jgi:hypothetical protein
MIGIEQHRVQDSASLGVPGEMAASSDMRASRSNVGDSSYNK